MTTGQLSQGNGERLAEETVRDETENNDIEEAVNYRITSYGVDFDVEGLVRRINGGDIFVPDFQRGFVWNFKQASQFIESLLLGLPVPGIFLTMEPATEKLMVIDGQQRLKTLQYFYSGKFGDGEQKFALQGVTQSLAGKQYADLRQPDRRRLDNSLFHATITRQLFPDDGMSSIFHIFQRLNSTGQRLTPQEIRQAMYRGTLLDNIREMNVDGNWRTIFGRTSPRQKDQELILRFWAMHVNSEKYAAPMLGFLNDFAVEHRNPDQEFLNRGRYLFREVMELFNIAVGNRAFRTDGSRQMNAAVFDSMSVGLARRIATKREAEPSPDTIQAAHDALLKDSEYIASVSGGTAQTQSVQTRLRKAAAAFGGL